MTSVRHFLARALQKVALKIDSPVPQIEFSDEFIDWLSMANAGMLERGNLHLIELALRQLPSDAPILEIGSFCGLSANILTHLKMKYHRNNRLITCDKWMFEGSGNDMDHVGDSQVDFSGYRSFVKESFLRNTRFFSPHDLPSTVEMTSGEFFEAWRKGKSAHDVFRRPLTLGGPISFCFIDGNHSYVGVKSDFLGCDAFLEKGGYLLFDDSTVMRFGVHKLMPEVLATGRYVLVAQNPNHLFQKTSD